MEKAHENKDFSIDSLNIIEEKKYSKDAIHSLCLLSDQRLAFVSDAPGIKIFNLETNEQEFNILGHEEIVYYLSLLDNGNLLSSSGDWTIKIWEIKKHHYLCIQTLRGHCSAVVKAVQLSENRIGSCSYDKTIKIWKNQDSTNLSYQYIASLNKHNDYVRTFIELKNTKFIVSAGDYEDRSVCFWKREESEYTCARRIFGIECRSTSSIIEMEENKIIIGEKHGIISILNTGTLQIETRILVNKEKIGDIYSFILLKNNYMICGDGEGNIVCFEKLDELKFESKKGHMFDVSILALGKDHQLFTCSRKTIKIWNY